MFGYHVRSDGDITSIRSDNYNSDFNMVTGEFRRWGATVEDDPDYCPFSPEIIDLEISSGMCNGACYFCYKGNGTATEIEYMSFDIFKAIFDKLDTNITKQIAFGITDIEANPDFWKIVEYTRQHGVVPNYTTNGICVDSEIAQRTHDFCGAVSVSIYRHNRQTAYDAIKKFTDTGMTQVNIHFMLAHETMDFAYEILNDLMSESRLSKVNAIVFLQYKDKNPNAQLHSPNFEEYKKLVDFCLDQQLRFGFDSCSSSMFMKSVINRPNANELIQYVDNCESYGLFSGYINVEGIYYPCSFLEGMGEWKEGINVLKTDSFIKDIWYSERVDKARQRSIHSTDSCKCVLAGKCRTCLEYEELSRCTN